MPKIVLLIAGLALVAGACSSVTDAGQDTTPTTTTAGSVAEDAENLPPASGASEEEPEGGATTSTVATAARGEGTDTTGAVGGIEGASGGLPPPVVPGGDEKIDPNLQPLIEMAVADLAQRLGVGAAGIEVLAAYLVVWPDSSLGCPQPGMQYLQVLTDGSLILLGSGGAVYRYHTGGSQHEPFLCTTPSKTAQPEGEGTITIPPPTEDKGGGEATEGTGEET